MHEEQFPSSCLVTHGQSGQNHARFNVLKVWAVADMQVTVDSKNGTRTSDVVRNASWSFWVT